MHPNPKSGIFYSACTRDRRGSMKVHAKTLIFKQEGLSRKIDENASIEWEEVYAATSTARSKEENPTHLGQVEKQFFWCGRQRRTCTKELLLRSSLSHFVKCRVSQCWKKTGWCGERTEESLSRRNIQAEFEMKFEPQFDVTVGQWCFASPLRAEILCQWF